jgi:hypothetical protein
LIPARGKEEKGEEETNSTRAPLITIALSVLKPLLSPLLILPFLHLLHHAVPPLLIMPFLLSSSCRSSSPYHAVPSPSSSCRSSSPYHAVPPLLIMPFLLSSSCRSSSPYHAVPPLLIMPFSFFVLLLLSLLRFSLPSLSFTSPLLLPVEPVSLLEVEVTDLDRRVGLCVGSTDEVRSAG